MFYVIRYYHMYDICCLLRVTWGKVPPFGDDLSLTYLFASTSEKSYMYLTNYVMCIMTEYHMRSDNMSAEIRLLIAAPWYRCSPVVVL